MKQLLKYLTEEDAVNSVGKGWEHLVRRVYSAKDGLGIPIGIIQVKEKHGGLRIYTEYYVPEIEDVIRRVGWESLKTCEECGEIGILSKSAEGWYKTRCNKHMDNYTPIPVELV